MNRCRPTPTRRARIIIAFCGLLGASASAQSLQPPDSLRRLEADRAKWQNSRLVWTSTRDSTPGVTNRFETLQSANDQITISHGDDEGVLIRLPDGKPHPFGVGPWYSMTRDGEWWRYTHDAAFANCAVRDDPQRGALDARTLGLSADSPAGDLARTLWGDQNIAWKYRESREGGRIVVTAESERYQRVWVLDPAADGLPVRVYTLDNGQIVRDSRISLAKFGDHWYPSTVEYYHGDSEKGALPVRVIQVTDVVSNTTDLPKAGFSPEDIGVEDGMTINHNNPATGTGSTMFWHEGRMVPADEWAEMLRKGTATTSPAVRAKVERGVAVSEVFRALKSQAGSSRGPAAAVLHSTETRWERYTTDFIRRYELDASQSQKAMLFLDAAKAEMQRFGAKHAGKISALGESMTRIAALREPHRSKEATEWAKIRQQLVEDLDTTIQRMLVPDLEQIPTSAQRKVHDSRLAAQTKKQS